MNTLELYPMEKPIIFMSDQKDKKSEKSKFDYLDQLNYKSVWYDILCNVWE